MKKQTMTTDIFGYLYTATLTGLAVYAAHIVVLVTLYLWRRREAPPPLPEILAAELPVVTVQVPLRNERYVVQRVLRSVAALDWPREKLEIQVLDDSDDATTSLAQQEAARLRAQGVDIRVLHRARPQGYKAGALAAGLQQARGEFLALFDADFRPPPDFLRRTVPYFAAAPRLGMVQARWEHINADYSAVTRAQALLLDAHFTIEHIARNRSGLLMNFNGTAGIWRRQAIEDSGGWQSDTVAEDLDLSYRAQLHGWRALYLPHVTAAAELPPLVAAFKQQQYRWAKGAAQVFRKLAGPLLRTKQLSPFQKIMALLHLSGYCTQPLFLLLLLLTLPMILYNPQLPTLAAILGASLTIPPALYLLGQWELHRDWPRRILAYPVLMLLGVGVAWSNTLALLDGFAHWGGTFARTPKFRLETRRGEWKHAAYRLSVDHTILGESLIALYALVAVWQSLNRQQGNFLPLILIYACGELLMIGSTLFQAWTVWEHRARAGVKIRQ